MMRAFAVVGGWTMMSRILGFVRDMLMSRILGAGLVADAFNTAFLLPNLFRRFLAEGALNNAFLPQYSKLQNDPEAAQDFVKNTFSSLVITLLILISVIQIFMPAAILLLASGFVGDPRFEMAQSFSRITIFYIAFMSLASFCASILNSHARFGYAAAAPVLLNITLIIVFMMIYFLGIQGEEIGIWLSWGVLFAGLLQFGLVFFGVRKLGIQLRFGKPKWNDELKTFLAKLAPILISSGVVQINLVVGRQIASWTEGAMSWLNYADRLYQLPMGVVGVATGTVLLTSLTELRKEGNDIAAQGRFNEAVFFSAFLVIPAAIALFVIPIPLVKVVFEGGAFERSDTIATAMAVQIYAIGLPAAVFQMSQNKLFYAREDTRTPVIYAMISMIVNVVIALVLWNWLDYLAPVVASVVSGIVMSVLLFFGARRFGEAAKITKETLKRISIVFLCAVMMGLVCYGLSILFSSWLEQPFLEWIALLLIVLIAMAVYFGLAFLILRIYPRELFRR